MRKWLVCLVMSALAASMAAIAQASPQAYTVDAQKSAIHWLVYRAGAFSRFGHNHVISVGELTGSAMVDRDDLASSTFELQIPVAGLAVDDPTLRAGLGEEFSSKPSEDDIAGTRRNMLSERVLDAEHHPLVRVTGSGPTGSAGAQKLKITLQLLGRSVDVEVPTSVTFNGDELVATGEFQLTHEQLGMEPFSVMGGALSVGNELDFTYRIHARPAGAGESTQ